MSETLFLRLLSYDDKSAALAESIKATQEGYTLNTVVHVVNPKSFSQIPGSTFAYWVSERIRRVFTRLPAFESEGRTVKQGLATADDFRFVRLYWEVKPGNALSGTSQIQPEQFRQQTFSGKRWVPFAKGGAYSPYYSDLHLVVNWERDGEEMKYWAGSLYNGSHWSRIIKNVDFYFCPGLTWPSRPHKRGAFSHVAAGAIFSHTGTMLFLPEKDHWATSALLNSDAFIGLLHLLMARGGAQSGQTLKYEIGYVASVPIPHIDEGNNQELSQLALEAYSLSRVQSTVNETCHLFYLPALLQINGDTLATRVLSWQNRLDEINQQFAKCQERINVIAFRLYGIFDEDRRGLEESLRSDKQEVKNGDEEIDSEVDDNTTEEKIGCRDLIGALLSYTVGCASGCWDIRFATGELVIPKLSDPFAPLPVCSPGILIGNDGLPLPEAPRDYPLGINWEGILVDDPDHPDDIIHRVQDVLKVIWPDRAEAIEQEACQILEIKELREYFRRSGNGGFWMDHVRRYSKSRRKAPIYWLLQSSKKNYALWLYYHRLDKDTLFKALTKYVEPKLRLEEGRLGQFRTQLARAGSTGREVKQLEKQLERQESLMAELYDFRDKLRRAADLNLEPDLSDGVVLNIAPLWELVPWSEARKYWEELKAGKYEWSSISKQLRESKVTK